MNKLFSIIVLFFLNISFAQENITIELPLKIKGSKNIPLELNLLLDSLQKNDTTKDDRYNKILNSVLNIDSYAKNISSEDIFLVGKIEIYKNLLKSNSFSKNATLDQAMINNLKLAISKSSDPFNTWFLKALLSDCENIMTSKNFNDYSLQKSNNQTSGLEYKKMDKKIQILYRWLSKINPDSPDFESLLSSELQIPMYSALHGIEHSFYLMASSTNFEPFKGLNKVPEQMKFFVVERINPSSKSLKKEKSLDDILDPVISSDSLPLPSNLPKPTSEDWLKDENTPNGLKNLPKAGDDSDWLEDF